MQIHIDISVIVLIAALFVMISLIMTVLGVLRGTWSGDRAYHWLIGANCAFLVATLALSADMLLPFWLGAMGVIGGALFGIVFGFFAILHALGRPAPVMPLVGFALAALGAQTLLAVVMPDTVLLMLTSSAINGPLGVVLSVLVWRAARPMGAFLAMLMMMPLAVLSIGYLIRLGAILITPDALVYGVATAVIILLMAGAAIQWGFGLVALRSAQLARSLDRERVRAEAASEAKSDFLRSMSHELRTPLNAVIGLAELMRRESFGPMPEAYRDHAAHIHASGEHLLELIEDLLDLSAIEAGVLRLNEEDVAVDAIMGSVHNLIRERARQAEITLTLEGNAREVIRADRRRMVQSLLNLVSNAVKYAPSGSEVHVRTTRDAAGWLLISVIDRGPGMTEQDIREALRLFSRLRRVDIARIEGNGIGLPLARELIHAHGGELRIESTPGQGTTASIALPVRRILAPAPEPASEPAVAS
ncbi:MAG: ATP-binding protein [Pseudomonadota bacterium]